jgi:hypothetical protein
MRFYTGRDNEWIFLHLSKICLLSGPMRKRILYHSSFIIPIHSSNPIHPIQSSTGYRIVLTWGRPNISTAHTDILRLIEAIGECRGIKSIHDASIHLSIMHPSTLPIHPLNSFNSSTPQPSSHKQPWSGRLELFRGSKTLDQTVWKRFDHAVFDRL